jgi:DNA-binding transcriptional regulator GbsR (MarR family)
MSDTQRATDLATDAIGQLIEFWGFKRIMGRIWSTLYLADEPMSAKDLATQIRVSVSLVSTTVNELLLWGVVRRAPRPGGRADVFEAETNLWKMLSKVLKERETFRLDTAVERLAAARAELDMKEKGPEAARRKVIATRIERLERLSGLMRGLIDVLVEDGKLDVTGLKDVSLADEG